jgi:hypothetical protein
MVLAACGGGSSSATTPTVLSVTVSAPSTGTSFYFNGQGTFTATVSVTNGASTAVTWSATGGTITSAGLYTAPATAGTYTITATSQADPTKSGTATVTVAKGPNPTITSAAPPTTAVGGSLYTFTFTATDPANTAITFALTTAPTGVTITGGTLSWTPTAAQTGVANNFTLTVTTLAGGSTTYSWTVTPTPHVLSVTITPPVGGTQADFSGTLQFSAVANLYGTGNTGVTWSVQEGAAGGTITSGGLYTAPRTAGTYHVVATAQLDGTTKASATVTVVAGPNPTITSAAPPTTVVGGSLYTFTFTATDPANTAITFTLTTAPTGATLTGATLNWTPTAAQTGVANNFTLTVTTYAGGSTTYSWTVTPTAYVQSVTISPATGAQTYLNGTVQFTGSATLFGTGNTAVTWTVQEGAAGGSITSAGLYTAPGSIGTYHVVATAQLDGTTKASAAVAVVVGPSPTITTTAPTSATGGSLYTYTIAATDPANSAITYTLTTAPSGATLTGATLKWTPTAAQTNMANNFTITVTTFAGGTATQSWTVTPAAPAVTFTSTPGTSATVNTAYSYTAVATDIFGSTMTYVFTAPPGATTTANSVTWTPTTGRLLQAISVTATSSLGGTATQNWTVNVPGAITVTAADNYWSLDGTYTPLAAVTSGGYDLSDVKAFVPNPDGTVTTLAGTDNGNGTATIANVPAGRYWLQVTRGEWFWTDSSSFQYGQDYIGRNVSTASTVTGTTLNWQLSGLYPWEAADNLNLYAPNAGVTGWPPSATCVAAETVGSTTFQSCDLDPYANYAITPTLGDVSYLLQTYADPITNATLMRAMGANSALALANSGGDVAVFGNLASNTGSSWELSLSGASTWTTYQPMVNPTFDFSGSQGHADLYLQQQTEVPNVLAQTIGMLPILDYPIVSATANLDLGQFYDYSNNVVGPFTTLFAYEADGTYSAGGLVTVPVSLGHIGATIPSSAQPDTPQMSPVATPAITSGGTSTSLFAAATASDAFTLSWTAPTGTLPAIGYRVTITPALATDPTLYLYTDTASLTVPAGLLTNGHTYVFTVRAVADAQASFTTSPFHSGFPVAWADAVSGTITYNTAAAPISLAIPTSVAPRTATAKTSGVHKFAPPVSPLAKPAASKVK